MDETNKPATAIPVAAIAPAGPLPSLRRVVPYSLGSVLSPTVEIRTAAPATIPKVANFQVVLFVHPSPPSPLVLRANLLAYDGGADIPEKAIARVTDNHKITLEFDTTGGVTGKEYILMVELTPITTTISDSWGRIALA